MKYDMLCKTEKSRYYQTKVEENVGNQKGLFQVINEIKCNRKVQVLPTGKSNVELANVFADYFETKILKISNTFNPILSLPSPSPPNNVSLLTDFKPTNEEALRKIILSGNSKACSLDPLPTYLLQEIIDSLLPTLTKLVNSCIE